MIICDTFLSSALRASCMTGSSLISWEPVGPYRPSMVTDLSLSPSPCVSNDLPSAVCLRASTRLLGIIRPS